jgi:hypothetical protein
MITVETLKSHYPQCSKIFDQIQSTKESENAYKEKYAKEIKAKSKEYTPQASG